MEYYVRDGRRTIPPWIWILVVLLALILIFVVWWAVAAQSPERTVVVPGQQPTTPPVQQPAQQPSAQPTPQPAAQPQVVQRPVTIYVVPGQTPPTVYVVPEGQQPPQATQRPQQVKLPGEFSYEGKNWEPADQAVTSDSVQLKDTGAQVAGSTVYAESGDQAPYMALYLETAPGSGVYLKYQPM